MKKEQVSSSIAYAANLIFSSYSEVNELDLENKGGIGRDDTTGASGTIGIVGRAGQDGLLTLLELSDAFVPTPDDLADTNDEVERLSAADGGVEDCAVCELASVVDLDSGAGSGARASSLVELLDGERHMRKKL